MVDGKIISFDQFILKILFSECSEKPSVTVNSVRLVIYLKTT